MDAFARECVQVESEACHEGLALAGLHLGDLAAVEDDATHQLDVEVAQTDRPPARLSTQGERLDEELVQVVAVAGLFAQGVGARPQGVVVKRLELVFEPGDRAGHREVALDLALVWVQQLAEESHRNSGYPAGVNLNRGPAENPRREIRRSRRPRSG